MKDITGLSARSIRAGDCGYIAYHAPRYAFLLQFLIEHGVRTGSTLLDIGPSRLTALIRERLDVQVDSLGFGPDRAIHGATHFEFDLNLTAFYFDARFAHHVVGHIAPQPLVGSAKNVLYRLLPARLREGITMVWRKPEPA